MIAVPRFRFLSSPFVSAWIWRRRAAVALALLVACANGWAWGQNEELSPSSLRGVALPVSKAEPSTPTGVPWQAGTSYPTDLGDYPFAQDGENFYVIEGNAVRRYNATTDIWTTRAAISNSGGAAVFYAGKIYFATRLAGNAGAFRIYDVAQDTWSSGAARPGVVDSYGGAAGAYNGKVYVVGGGANQLSSTLLSIYDIAGNSWTTGPNAPAQFYGGSYAQSGQFLYLIGSILGAGSYAQTSMRLDMASNTWSTGPAWTPARGQFALAAAGTKLVAMGGFDGGNVSAEVLELDTTTWPTGAWVASPDNLPSARFSNSAGFVSTGRAGGEIWTTGGSISGGVREHIFRAMPTCLGYDVTVSAGTIVPGALDTGNHGDDVSTVVALPFSYRLYDQTFSSVSVGSNGHLTFGTVNNTSDPTCIPVAGATYAIGPYWTDQCTGPCGGLTGVGPGIFTSITGSAPNRIFNIEWRTVYYTPGSTVVPLNYEVRLYESQPIFDVIYGTVNPFTPPAPRNLSTGVQKNEAAGQFTLQGCDPTGGTAPPVTAGFRLRYTLASTACAAAAPAPTGFLYAAVDSSAGNQIYGFSVNETSGVLTALNGFPVATAGNGDPNTDIGILVTDPVNQRLYVINAGSNTVSAFVINPSSGALAPMPFSPFALGAGDWTTLAVHPTGSPLLVASNVLKSFNITSSTAVEAAGSPFARNGGLSSVFSRNGDFFYEGGAGASFGGFSVNPANGVLTALSGSPFNSGGSGPTAYVTDSQGRLLCETDGGGMLRAFTTASGIPSAVTGNPFASGLSSTGTGLLHPNERFYFLSDFNGARFGSFRMNGSGAGTTLTPAAGSPFSSATNFPFDLETNQAGAFLFGLHPVHRSISTYAVNSNTGALSNTSVQPNDTLGTAGVATDLAYTNASMVRTAVSRKTHGAAGVFDVNLPLTGTPGVECRNGSGVGSGDHQIVVTFAAPIVAVESITLVSGTLTNGIVSINGQVVTIDLTGVANAQTLTFQLNGVSDGVNVGTVTVPIGFLVGDVTASRTVNSSDIGQAKANSGQTTTGANFRTDVTVSGSINSSDIGVVKSKSGTFLP